MNKRIVIVAVAVLSALSSFAQIAKCKGKYFGNVIGSAVPATYGGLWNQVTPENGTKWGFVEKVKGTYDWTEADLIYNWAKKNGALFKFHTFVWGSQMPDWVSKATTAELTASVENYMKAAAAHFGPMGGLAMIDVLNEPANPVLPDYMKAALTAGYRAEPKNAADLYNPYGWAIWPYQLARKYFPNAVLLTNEYNIEENWQGMRAPYIKVINAIKAAPNITDGKKNLIDGLGLQCHGVHQLTAANFKICLDEMWNGTGLPIHITEFDQAANPDEAKQKTVYSTLIPVAWEHPHVAGITLWGYVQGSTWIKGNAVLGPAGTDSGLQYPSTYTAKPYGDRPALTWLRQYFASKPSLPCCPAPAPLGTCYAPTVAISYPYQNFMFATTMTIPLTATAADVDGTVSSVTFYNGAATIGKVTAAPYVYNWKNMPAGTYSITAVAVDNSGMKTTSSTISFTVVKPSTNIYQCSGCTSPFWTTTSNWTPAVLPVLFDTAVVRTGEVKVSDNVYVVTKVEPNGIFRITDSIYASDLRLQGGILKSNTSTPVFILTSTISAEKASTIIAGSLATSTFRIDGTIKGSGGLKKVGVGVLQINANASKYTGMWEVAEGKLKLRSTTGIGLCGVQVDSLANLDVETIASTNMLIVKKGGIVNLDGNLTVQVAQFGTKNIPAGTYTAANYPGIITGVGTLTVVKSLLVVTPPVAGAITLTASSGTSYQWKADGNVLGATASFTPAFSGAYTVIATNSVGCVATSAPVYVQRWDLQKGWNLVSTNLYLADSSFSTLFSTIDVQEVKTFDVFWRKGQDSVLNSLRSLTSGSGYWLYSNAINSLFLCGEPNKQSVKIPAVGGWQLIGCPYQNNVGFEKIFNTSNCTVIKDFSGFWIPSGSMNSIINLEPSKAYFFNRP